MKDVFEKKVILITGGTGFLGRSLITEILQHSPSSIRVFSRDEVKHHMVQEQFQNDPKLRYFVGDVRDYERLDKAMRGVDIVIHAAALKRLDLIEYNVEECIKTNIMGSLNCVRAALKNNVQKALFVSTDKACSPVNTYGASKFVGERIFVESNYSKGSQPTVFSCVRYGNVLQSTGSVIPFFAQRIKNRQAIPLTDERMTRFIIDNTEAVHLIYNALKLSLGGEVFVPKLESFRITDLIEVLKEVFNAQSKVEIIGMRPGEKLHEVMVNDSESIRTFEHENMFIIKSQIQEYNEEALRKAVYLKKGRKLGAGFKEFSSRDHVIDKDRVRKLLEGMGLV